jgi:hypothetical protein
VYVRARGRALGVAACRPAARPCEVSSTRRRLRPQLRESLARRVRPALPRLPGSASAWNRAHPGHGTWPPGRWSAGCRQPQEAPLQALQARHGAVLRPRPAG